LATIGQIAEAEKEYAEVVRIEPANALAHLDLGVMQARLGQFDEALRQFEETLRLEPGNQQARENIDKVQGWKNRRR
jgi:Flp pilus assembly protein TadD